MKKQLFAAAILATGMLCGCAAGETMGTQPVTVPNFTVDRSVTEGERIRPASLVSEGAVLQQQAVVRFWGQYPEDGPVAVAVNDTLYYGTCEDGTFEVLIRTGEASKGNTVTVYTPQEKKTLNDVWFGEVYLCAGQSNMQYTLAEMPDYAEEDDTDIRAATVPVLSLEAPVTEPMTETTFSWLPLETAAPNVSAAGYYFAHRMARELDCPVGIVVCAAGDTIIASWLPQAEAEALPPIYQEDRPNFWLRSAGHMYNTMLSPILKGTFRSVVWYQGENQSYQYDQFLTKMIQSWRAGFEDPDLPFTIIELVGCGEVWLEKWPELRAMQKSVCDTVPGCTLSVSVDLGEEFEIHPTDKKPVGERAAYATLNALYGGNYPAPSYLETVTRIDETLRLTFTDSEGLTMKACEEAPFEVSPDGRAWYPATAELDGETVVLTCQEGLSARYVRYAWVNFSPDLAVLFNGNGMPADSFLVELDSAGTYSSS